MSLTVRPGGKLCFSLSAFSRSFTQSVYRYLLQRTLNFTTSLDFLILTDLASFLRAVSRKSLISEICFGCHGRSAEVRRSQGQAEPETQPHMAQPR